LDNFDKSSEIKTGTHLAMDTQEGSSSTLRDHPTQVTRDDILQLMKSRTAIDEQIDALASILTSNRVGMIEPLVDAEGFPRNDIDVYQVRHARQRIICLQNDRKKLTAEIETKLTIFHENTRQNGTVVEEMETELSRSSSSDLSPIATVNFVADGSPAFQAGLRVNDTIISVGAINSRNFRSLADIGNLVQQSQGQVVDVTVNRNGALTRLALIPGPWSGRGLIGCNIIPIETPER